MPSSVQSERLSVKNARSNYGRSSARPPAPGYVAGMRKGSALFACDRDGSPFPCEPLLKSFTKRPLRISLLPMRVFEIIQKPSSWVRVAILALMVGLGLNSIAHVAHAHDTATHASQHAPCGYCVHLGHLSDAPRHAYETRQASAFDYLIGENEHIVRSLARELSAQPRAPPHFLRRLL